MKYRILFILCSIISLQAAQPKSGNNPDAQDRQAMEAKQQQQNFIQAVQSYDSQPSHHKLMVKDVPYADELRMRLLSEERRKRQQAREKRHKEKAKFFGK